MVSHYGIKLLTYKFGVTSVSFFRVYCLVGDGEAAEGSIWEALHFASHYKLDNLVVIFDVNRLGQSEPTSLQHQVRFMSLAPVVLLA